LLHLVGFLYYFTYIDDARSNTNQVNFFITKKLVHRFPLLSVVLHHRHQRHHH
jgi:hypothetical protein